MADEQQRKPSFKHAVARKAVAPVVASLVTYLTKKALELWQEKLQPRLEEQGGVEALAQRTAETVKSKVPSPSSEGESQQQSERKASSSDGDRSKERQKREQRRQQRRRALEQSGSS